MKQIAGRAASRASKYPRVSLFSPSTVRGVSSAAHNDEGDTTLTTQSQKSANGQTTGSQPQNNEKHAETPKTQKKKEKSSLELDEELRQKMSGIAGDGGESGVEYEDGKPVAMKRGVRENMFRYI